MAEVIIVGAGLIDVWLLMDEPRRSLAGAAGALRTYTLVHGGSPVPGAGQSTATGLSEELSFWFGSSTVVE